MRHMTRQDYKTGKTRSGAKIVDEVNVFSMQDSYAAPIEPTPTLTFTSYGVRAFEVQYWTGTASARAG